MKKIISIVLCMFLFVWLMSYGFAASADTGDEGENLLLIGETAIQEEDGSEILIQVYEEPTLLRAGGSKSGQKSYTAKNSSGQVQWKFTVKGSFTYTGSSATCTSSSYTSSISNSEWSLKSASASKSGNKATATGTYIRKLLGITVDTKTVAPSLSCDKNGNLS